MSADLPDRLSAVRTRSSGSLAGQLVTLSQQLLALAVVLAVLTPAAMVVSMDVVAPRAAHPRLVSVPGGPVHAEVTDYALTAAPGTRARPGSLRARTVTRPDGTHALTSDAVPVTGYGTVGVTWAQGSEVPEDEIGLRLRYRDDGAWSRWLTMHYHDDHGPDPGSAEARRARPGTDELVVGDVDEVQVRIESRHAAPSDVRLSVVDPGEPTTTVERPARPAAPETADGDPLATPRPVIRTRKQWGADERMRDKGSLRYGEVHAGFVHHTVNANDYDRDDVPAILRGIYAYHTQSLGWSDVGYNYLVDKFGRIWEGRYGGIDRAVVGAHTLGYNDDSFAMSAIGNFETARPTAKMLAAYAKLFAWKLSLHGVDAASTRQYVTSRYFQAINGHRDAGSTACPGRYLYAKIPQIRTAADRRQVDFEGRNLRGDLDGDGAPDLVVRRSSDHQLMVLPVKAQGDGYRTGRPVATGVALAGAKRLLSVGDWDGDGAGDVVVQRTSGSTVLYHGDGTGRLAEPTRLGDLANVGRLAAVGDMTGDGWPDLMGQPSGGSMMIYPGRGDDGLGRPYAARSSVPGGALLGAGRWNADGAPDTLVRSGTGLQLYPGNGPGGLMAPASLDGDALGGYDWLVGLGPAGGTGHADLVARSRQDGRLYLLPGVRTGLRQRVPLGADASGYDLVG